ATPVFVDIRSDTMNLDESLLEPALTERTRAIVPVHYAGVGCDMTAITRMANSYGLPIVEDAAQGIGATYAGRPLGTLGLLGAITEHRRQLWHLYYQGFAEAEELALLRRPIVPDQCGHNAHMFYLLLPDASTRGRLIAALDSVGINAVFHYIPLHSSPAGRKY